MKKNKIKIGKNKSIRDTQSNKIRKLRNNIELIKEEVCGDTIIPKFNKKSNGNNKLKKVEKKVEQLEKEFLEFYDEIMTSLSVVHENQKFSNKGGDFANKIKKNSNHIKDLKSEHSKIERKLKSFKFFNKKFRNKNRKC